jgi:hypothetical protein
MAKTAREVVKKVKNAILYSDGTIRIDNVRASYPHTGEPYSKNGEKGKFGIVAMLPKSTHVEAKDLVKSVMDKLLADNDAKVAADKKFLRNGDDSGNESYEGHWTISASESRRPSVRDRDGSLLTPEEAEEKIYGGCWVNVLIRPWYQDGVKVGKGFGKRVNSGLVGVQFVRDDEPFGEGRIDDEGVWDDEGEGSSSDDDDL